MMISFDSGKKSVASGLIQNLKFIITEQNCEAENELNPLPVANIALCQTRVHVIVSTQLLNVCSV